VKKVFLLLIAAIALACMGYAVYFKAATHKTQNMMGAKEGGMEWLRSEFHLDDVQYSKIKALHDAFEPECDKHCRDLAEANRNLAKLMQESPEYSPEIAHALEKCAEIKSECRKATLGQIYAVSHLMGSDEGLRYRRMMAACLVEQSSPKNNQLDSRQ